MLGPFVQIQAHEPQRRGQGWVRPSLECELYANTDCRDDVRTLSIVHLRAFALCFGSTKRGACHEIATDLLPVSSLPMDLMPHIVHIRESLQLVGAQRERLLRPAGCLFLLLEKGRLKVSKLSRVLTPALSNPFQYLMPNAERRLLESVDATVMVRSTLLSFPTPVLTLVYLCKWSLSRISCQHAPS